MNLIYFTNTPKLENPSHRDLILMRKISLDWGWGWVCSW